MSEQAVEFACGMLHGTVAVLLGDGWTPEQIHDEVDKAIREEAADSE